MRAWLSATGLAALLMGSPEAANATAIASGFNSPGANIFAGFSLQGLGGSLDGLTFTPSVIERSASTFIEGNALAVGQAGNGPAPVSFSGVRASVSSGVTVGARADAFGHAVGEARLIVGFELTNTSDHAIDFALRGFYGLGTHISVTDILSESVLAFWNATVRIDADPVYRYGEGNRTIDCSNPLKDKNACPNFYDSSDDIFGWQFSLDPGESLGGRLTTIARYEATAVPEPSTLLLLAASGLGLVSLRRRASA